MFNVKIALIYGAISTTIVQNLYRISATRWKIENFLGYNNGAKQKLWNIVLCII